MNKLSNKKYALIFAFLSLLLTIVYTPFGYDKDRLLPFSFPNFKNGAYVYQKLVSQDISEEYHDPKLVEKLLLKIRQQRPLSSYTLALQFDLEAKQGKVNKQRALTLREKAHQIDFRSRRNAIILADLYAQQGEFKKMVKIVNNLLNAEKPASEVHRASLKYLKDHSSNLAIKKEIARFLENDVEWTSRFLSQYFPSVGVVELSPELGEYLSRSNPSEAINKYRSSYLEALIKNNFMDLAWKYWNTFSLVGDQNLGVFNANFENSKALPPFNWSYGSKGFVTYESGSEGGLFLSTNSEDILLSLRQIIRLPAGRNLFEVKGDHFGGKQGMNSGYWLLDCLATNERLWKSSKLFPTDNRQILFSQTFSVDGNCSDYLLRFYVKAGAGKRRNSFHFYDVSIKLIE